MQITAVKFTENSEKDLADILLFQIFKQEMPQEVAISINES